MSRKRVLRTIALGIACALLLLLASLYAVRFNDSRLVEPMDMTTYAFRLKDVPMIAAIALTMAYGLYLMFLWVRCMMRAGRMRHRDITPRINPRLGYLGLLGLLGFMGFITYPVSRDVFPFIFFGFFGFFGYFFAGRMSGTMMDERYRENAMRAELAALRSGFSIVLVALLLLCRGALFGSLEYTLIAVIITLALAFALVVFLSQYLLYRYDYEDAQDAGGE